MSFSTFSYSPSEQAVSWPSIAATDPLSWWTADSGVAASQAGKVSSWLDGGRSANTMVQGTGSKQPSLVTNQLNGKPVLRFDGVDDCMSSVVNYSGIAGMSMAWVIKPKTVAINKPLLAPNRSLAIMADADGVRTETYWVLNGVWTTYAGTGYPNGNRYLRPFAETAHLGILFSGQYSFNNGVFFDGAQAGSAHLGGLYYQSGVKFGTNWNESAFGPVDIAEVILWDRMLDADEILAVSEALTTKYGLTSWLPAS